MGIGGCSGFFIAGLYAGAWLKVTCVLETAAESWFKGDVIGTLLKVSGEVALWVVTMINECF